MSVQEKIIEIIAEQALLEPGDISPDTKLEDIGLDSVATVETVFSIEEAFDIQVPFNANNPEESTFDISSVASIVAAVEGLMNKADA